MGQFSMIRSAGIVAGIVALFVALIGRVAYLQTYGREISISRADRQQHLILTLSARRGPIYDRNGFELAGSIQLRHLYIDPKFMQEAFQEEGHTLIEMDEKLDKLAQLVGKDSFALSQMLGDRSTSRYVKIADNLDDATVTAIEAMHLPGVGIDATSTRCYPMGSLAAHILGGCGSDGNGLDGLELKYNALLAGKPGFARETKDAQRRPIGVSAEDYLPPQHGQDLVLTIDVNLQRLAEQELRNAVEHVQAKRGEFVVLNCRTGEVLALCNYPTFNPQILSDSTPESRRNSAVIAPYEPGSTFKPFMVGPALMWHITTPWEMWQVPGKTWLTPYGRAISDVEYTGNLCTWDGLVHSSNIVMSQLAERLGNPRLFKAISSFGFGRRTGIDLPREDSGLVNNLPKWHLKTTESVAMGYEVMVTPLQLARAFCAIANGGRLVTPHLLLGTVDPAGNVLTRKQKVAFDALPRAIDEETAATERRILCDVLIRGTAEGVRSRTWNIAGKTGTAHIADSHGYSKTRYNSSFMAMAPYEDPQIVTVCVIHDPNPAIAKYGGKVAAPSVVSFIERAFTYMQVPASPDLPLPSAQMANVLYDYSDKMYLDRNFGAPKVSPDDAEEVSATVP